MTLAVEQFDELPLAMREARRWLVWRAVPNSDATKKPRKVPFYVSGHPRNGALDTDQDRANLATFADALAVLPRYTGLGFALGPDATGAHWQGVDLDDLQLHPDLAVLADDGLPGYTETSPSGRGMHAIGYGRAFATLGSNGTGIEAYSAGRYFTVTADNAGLGEPCDLADYVTRTLAPLHSRHAPPVSAEVLDYVDPRTIAELRSALAAMRADDRDLWVSNGQRLKRLGEPGRALWLEWSQQSDKFDPQDAARVWDSFTADRTGYQAVFAEAQRRGWLNPLSGAAPAATPPQRPAALPSTLAAALTPLTSDELAAAATPHPHAFMSGDGRHGLFPHGEVTVIGAPGREGKTSAIMAIAMHYTLGWELAQMAPPPDRSVLIYSAEDDRAQYARKAAAQHSKLSPALGERFRTGLLIPDLHGPELAAWREIVRVENRAPARGLIVEPLIDAINALHASPTPPGLAIFETASTLSDAEEDNPGHKAMIAALKHFAKRTDLAVILVHHTSQAAASNLPELNISEADIRGGTTLVNNARQTFLLVNLASMHDPFPDGDARTLLREQVAPGETARVNSLICLSSSKCAEPAPLFFRWDDTPDYGPRLVELAPPAELLGKSWRAVRGLLAGARAEARADKKAEQGQANVRLVVRAATDLALVGEQPTARQVSLKCGRADPRWARPFLESAVELGELVRSTEQVPRTRGFTDVYRPPGATTEGASNAPWKRTSGPTSGSDE